MKYVGEFSNIIGRTFRLEVVTNDDISSSSVLTMSGDSPVVIKYEGDSDNIYKPIKYSSLTFKILVNDYLFDFFASTAMQNKVKLFDTTGGINSLIWQGYITPNLYSNGYESELEEMTVECVDDLAVLKYIDYQPNNGTKDVVDIKDIIVKYLNRDYVIFANNPWKFNNGKNNIIIIYSAKINEQNFFDEDNKPEKVSDVLEQICQYFNLTLTTYYSDGQLFYVFFDYDYLKNMEKFNNAMSLTGSNWDYNGHSDSTIYDTEIFSGKIDINHNSYAENGQTISLGEVYSKVSLKDSLYSYDSIIPEVFDDEKLTNIGSGWSDTTIIHNVTDDYWLRYYTSTTYRQNFYQITHVPPTSYNMGIGFTDVSVDNNHRNWDGSHQYIGAWIERQAFKYGNNNQPMNKLSLSDYIVLYGDYSAGLNGLKNPQQMFDNMVKNLEQFCPILSVNYENLPTQILGGNSTYIVINGSCLFDRQNVQWIPQTPTKGQIRNHGYAYRSELYVTCRLQIGNLYYTNMDTWNPDNAPEGVSGQWVTTPSNFRLYFTDDKKISLNDKNNKISADDVDLQVYNNIIWQMNIDEDGYAIKLPSAVNGKVIFSFFPPHNVWRGQDNLFENTISAFIKNFKIKTVVATDANTSAKDYDKDTEYTVTINNNFINEKKLDDFKICTFDNKKISYSCPVCDSFMTIPSSNNSYEMVMIDKVNDNIFNTNLRPEQHAIERYISQYGTPTITLNLSLKDYISKNNVYHKYEYLSMLDTFTDKFLPNKLFIINSMEKDILLNKVDLELIEKK